MAMPRYYVRDGASRGVSHHWDYLNDRATHGLCGHGYGEILMEGTDRPQRVCRACQVLLPQAETVWLAKEHKRLALEVRRGKATVDRLERENHELLALLRVATTTRPEPTVVTQGNSKLKARIRELEAKLDRQRLQLKQLQDARKTPRKKPARKKVSQPAAPKREPLRVYTTDLYRQPPPIRVVAGGLPGLGKRH